MLVLMAREPLAACHSTPVSACQDHPWVPSKKEMLRVVAADAVSQARFFLISYRLFLTHVLGLGPVDENPSPSRRRGRHGLSGRPSCQPVQWRVYQCRLRLFPHRGAGETLQPMSLEWLRSALRGSTDEGKLRLAQWRQQVIRAVESMQTTCVASLPLLFSTSPAALDFELEGPPYTAKERAADMFEGGLEGDVRTPSLRQTCVALQAPADVTNEATRSVANDPRFVGRLRRDVPQTGSVLSSLPGYLRSPQKAVGCTYGACLHKQALAEALETDVDLQLSEARNFVAALAVDTRNVVSRAGPSVGCLIERTCRFAASATPSKVRRELHRPVLTSSSRCVVSNLKIEVSS